MSGRAGRRGDATRPVTGRAPDEEEHAPGVGLHEDRALPHLQHALEVHRREDERVVLDPRRLLEELHGAANVHETRHRLHIGFRFLEEAHEHVSVVLRLARHLALVVVHNVRLEDIRDAERHVAELGPLAGARDAAEARFSARSIVVCRRCHGLSTGSSRRLWAAPRSRRAGQLWSLSATRPSSAEKVSGVAENSATGKVAQAPKWYHSGVRIGMRAAQNGQYL